jgi:hypothetical protein
MGLFSKWREFRRSFDKAGKGAVSRVGHFDYEMEPITFILFSFFRNTIPL